MRIKNKTNLDPLCAAVRRVRAASGLSQEKWAQRWSLATQTVSRFELGKQVPRGADILARLHAAATDAGLEKETNLFAAALEERPVPLSRDALMLRLSPSLWRAMQIARIAEVFFPEEARAIAEAAPNARAAVDEVISSPVISSVVSSERFDSKFYMALERGLDAVAERKAFENPQKRTR
jgi:transcriptional regulator with XRE-family HTH domain